MTRATSAGGRWVYTLYSNPGGTPFVHALDTVRGVAHCVGIPATQAEQNGLYNVVLTLHGQRLAVHWRSGRSWQNIDLASWQRLARPERRLPVALARRSGSALPRPSCSCCGESSCRRERFRPGRRNTPVSVEGGVMFRRLGLCLVVLGALVVVPGASAAFPGPYAVQGGEGVLSPDQLDPFRRCSRQERRRHSCARTR